MGSHIFGTWGIRKFKYIGILKLEDLYFTRLNHDVSKIFRMIYSKKVTKHWSGWRELRFLKILILFGFFSCSF